MSRASNLVRDLELLQANNLVRSYTKDTYPSEPNRIRWIVSVGPLEMLTLTTGEAEAFVRGVKLGFGR